MLQKLQNWIFPILQKRRFDDDEEIHLFLVMHVALLFAFVVHAFLLIMSFVGDEVLLSYTNMISFTAYCYCFFLVHKGRYAGAAVFLTVEVALYCLLSVAVRGVGNYNILYLVLVMALQVIIPYAKWPVRLIMSLFILACGVLLVVLEMQWFRQTNYNAIDYIYAIFNVVVIFFGLVIELMLSNIVREMVEDFEAQQMSEYRTQAYTDQLTGLYNRRYADMLFEQIKDGHTKEKYIIAMADIDDFKLINDTYGHPTGDDVLLYLADFFNDRFRKTDVVFRWGGEEFLVLLANIDNAQAYRILNLARKDLSEKEIPTRTKLLRITITIGAVALNPKDIEGSIAACDEKMYEGKRSGKNVVIM